MTTKRPSLSCKNWPAPANSAWRGGQLFPVIKSVMAGLAGEIPERTDGAEAFAADNCYPL